ncbi:MAG: branched-chain amino acid ABC transporter permease [Armatimonadota bacterium]|nr:branched-chain amino acid ABC transporter permease [Armatimonadota bacterium]MDR7440451.1 branched-chain amino acid ABC transporter permease [Armatimonadota bacterium]MDR7443517.1 branched-chain amino acid ABC transporter permease [Armatimonadota bacterium]MDR7570350.1 branched-chain amino acid ABC transporter permease [Armatimonadota bacterium]MDR7615016.1 branched-chain amino acid ABC transporter permease [Armatimonadota bacterium]
MDLRLFLEIGAGGVLLGGLYALIAAGLNLQYGLMRVLNVAHGEFVMLGAYVTYTLYTSLGLSPLLGLVLQLPLFFLLGWGIYGVVYRGVLEQGGGPAQLEANSLLLSFGLLFILENLALVVWGPSLRGYQYLHRPVSVFGTLFPVNRLVALGVALLLTVLLLGFLHRTALGTALRALMQDPEGAEAVGLPLVRLHGFSFGLGCALAGLTGALVSMLFTLTPSIGMPYTITALVVIILGGLGSVAGSLLGGLLLGVLEALGAYVVGADLRTALTYALLVAVLLFRPYGLFQAKTRSPGQAAGG